MEEISGNPNWVRNYGFCNFLKITSLYLFDIAQDCSLGQCLTSSGPETSKKNCGRNWGRNDLFYSNVGCPLKLACS